MRSACAIATSLISCVRPPASAVRVRPNTRTRPSSSLSRKYGAGTPSQSCLLRWLRPPSSTRASPLAGSAAIQQPRPQRCGSCGRRDRASCSAERRRRSRSRRSAGFKPGDAAGGRGNADRAAGVGADRPEAHAFDERDRCAAARSAAERDRSSGLRTAPNAVSSLVVPNANSCRLVLPTMTAPARRRLATTGAS